MNSATSASTISHLRTLFASQGLPECIVSDNGSVFTSAEFKEFVVKNGIHQSTSAPFQPASNGLAERAVQTFKLSLKKNNLGQ